MCDVNVIVVVIESVVGNDFKYHKRVLLYFQNIKVDDVGNNVCIVIEVCGFKTLLLYI